jgi:hypothetical protein
MASIKNIRTLSGTGPLQLWRKAEWRQAPRPGSSPSVPEPHVPGVRRVTGRVTGGYAEDLYNVLYRIPTGSSTIVLPSEPFLKRTLLIRCVLFRLVIVAKTCTRGTGAVTLFPSSFLFESSRRTTVFSHDFPLAEANSALGGHEPVYKYDPVR